MRVALVDPARDHAPAVRRGGDWEHSFGRHWKLDLTIMAVVVFLFGAIRPLADPDLPMHLTIGEWIVRHRAVPFTEPFSWTAVGQPYFAYSWLLQTLYYQVFQAFGHLGLRALQGLMVLGSACAALALGRAANLRPSQCLILAALNLIVGAFFVAMLRPQSILLITLPLIWAGSLRIAKNGMSWPALATLFVASAVTANSHLFFPFALAPAILFWVYRGSRLGTKVLATGSVIAGWLASPYALAWPQVIAFNFSPHALMRPPSAISELQPGFVVTLQPPLGPMLLLVAAMLALPWLVNIRELHWRERVMAAVYFGLGLVAFGFAVRLFVVWWGLTILIAAWAIAAVTRGTADEPPRLGFRLLGLAACLAIIATELVRTKELRAMEGTTTRRVLPTLAAQPAEQLAAWLVQHTRPDAHGRILTSFAFGSYLTWRLPAYSSSIDSRGLQPDSVSGSEAMVSASDRDSPVGPWNAADLAIVPTRFRVAALLDTAGAWRRLSTVPGERVRRDSVALWAKNEWWTQNLRIAPNR